MCADMIWLTHFLVVCIVLFGWLVPSIWLMYIGVLVATLFSTTVYGYCIMSKWEYDLRRKADPESVDYDFSYASYYTYRLTQGYLSNAFLARAGIVFVSLSLAIQLYFRYSVLTERGGAVARALTGSFAARRREKERIFSRKLRDPGEACVMLPRAKFFGIQ
ncbi:MAG TPA: DUF2784 family protein [Candidatus Paceibacterota bacterium]|nr:DUF2784 family protein [Candidatus Paceibacterota bacterium]